LSSEISDLVLLEERKKEEFDKDSDKKNFFLFGACITQKGALGYNDHQNNYPSPASG